MNNYEYIIAGLPEILKDTRENRLPDPEGLLAEIREQCSAKDAQTVDLLLSSFEPETLCEEFYVKALAHKEKFIREYFLFDLNVRNAKAGYLNLALGRPANQDTIHPGRKVEDEEDSIEEESPAFPEMEETQAALATGDLLERERALDRLYWDKVDGMVLFDVFNLDVILAFIVKLKITLRWLKLDPDTGRVFLRTLLDNIRISKPI